ncbi:hypothetical protein V6N13_015869 [Hibiscus sabdariffa]|uniref:Uncharacterized protein n=1 Tax=Hibiscus sabdariffa TaxID=183260 RepID=A0ABR2CWY9_9ROSI
MSVQNPIVASGALAYLNTDGRPLDLHEVASLPSLERPASLTLLEDQPIVKKSKSADRVISTVDIAAMDDDSDEGKQAAVHDNDVVINRIDNETGDPVTYASVAAKSTLNGSSADSDQRGVELQRDVDQIQQALQSEQPKQSKSVSVTTGGIAPRKNAAYVESNPTRKNKSKASAGMHEAIVISEHGAQATGAQAIGASGSKGRHSRNIGVKNVLGTVWGNLKGRRLIETRGSNGKDVSEFITELSDRLDEGDVELDDTEDISSDTDSR